TTTNLVGGAIGAGVPCPVHPKSHTQRSATAKPSTEGTAAIQRQDAPDVASTRKPNHEGSSQNHSPKNAAPTTREATVVGQFAPRSSLVIDVSISSKRAQLLRSVFSPRCIHGRNHGTP